MIIRPETPADYDEIHDMVKIAFETAEHCDGDEQDHVTKLRLGGSYIPGLALVAVSGGSIIGHIMLTGLAVRGPGREHAALLLSPLSVLLEHRQQGVGARLVRESLSRARSMGYFAVFLAGDPSFYGSFGFVRASKFGISTTTGVPDRFSLACELIPGALYGKSGTIDLL